MLQRSSSTGHCLHKNIVAAIALQTIRLQNMLCYIYIKPNMSVCLSVRVCVSLFLMHGHSFEQICTKFGMWHPDGHGGLAIAAPAQGLALRSLSLRCCKSVPIVDIIGHTTLIFPFPGQFVIRWLGLATVNLPITFEVSNSTSIRHEGRKKCRKKGGLGSSRSLQTIPSHTVHEFLLAFRYNWVVWAVQGHCKQYHPIQCTSFY